MERGWEMVHYSTNEINEVSVCVFYKVLSPVSM